MSDPRIDRLLSTRQLSGISGVPEGTLRYWRAIGYGPPSFRMGRRVVYRESKFLGWVAEQEVKT